MALEDNKYNYLEELGDSDFEIADGEPDIRGWEVKNENKKIIGDLNDLIFNPETRRVRYLVINLEDNELDLANRKVLIPIGTAELHDNDDEVILRNISAYQLNALPAYSKGNTSPEVEAEVRRIFEGVDAVEGENNFSNRENFYQHNHFDEDKFYNRNRLPIIEENLEIGKQEIETGKTRVSSRIVERPVEEKINLREEHVNVERHPVNRAVTEQDLENSFKEEEFEITEHAEVPVVNKEARIIEEVSIEKEVEEKEVNINETLRNTEVEEEYVEEQRRGRY